jgi:hypothetical protein
MVNAHVELGTKSPVSAAFKDLARASKVDVETAKKYFRLGTRELRDLERRTAVEIDALIADKKKLGVPNPKLAAFAQMAQALGQTVLIIERGYKRGSKRGK